MVRWKNYSRLRKLLCFSTSSVQAGYTCNNSCKHYCSALGIIGRPEGNVYRYVNIDTTNLEDSAVNKVVFYFKVEKGFGENIALLDASAISSITLFVGILTFVPAGLGTGTLTTQYLLEQLSIAPSVAAASVIYQTIVGTGVTLSIAAISSFFVKDKREGKSEESIEKLNQKDIVIEKIEEDSVVGKEEEIWCLYPTF